MDGIFKFVRLHGKYPCSLLHSVKIIYMGFEFYNAMVKRFLLYFSKCSAVEENKYAKVKVNMDSYRFYLPTRVWNFKSVELDSFNYIYS